VNDEQMNDLASEVAVEETGRAWEEERRPIDEGWIGEEKRRADAEQAEAKKAANQDVRERWDDLTNKLEETLATQQENHDLAERLTNSEAALEYARQALEEGEDPAMIADLLNASAAPELVEPFLEDWEADNAGLTVEELRLLDEEAQIPLTADEWRQQAELRAEGERAIAELEARHEAARLYEEGQAQLGQDLAEALQEARLRFPNFDRHAPTVEAILRRGSTPITSRAEADIAIESAYRGALELGRARFAANAKADLEQEEHRRDAGWFPEGGRNAPLDFHRESVVDWHISEHEVDPRRIAPQPRRTPEERAKAIGEAWAELDQPWAEGPGGWNI
jgi:hypothetical protein